MAEFLDKTMGLLKLDNQAGVKWEQRRSSVAGLTEYPTDSVHEEWQVGDTVQLRTEPFEL